MSYFGYDKGAARVRYEARRARGECTACSRPATTGPDGKPTTRCARCRRTGLQRARRIFKAALPPGAKLKECSACGGFGHNKRGCDVR